jgi:hypothetical protein
MMGDKKNFSSAANIYSIELDIYKMEDSSLSLPKLLF